MTACLLTLGVMASCGGITESKEHSLVGKWHKISDSSCAFFYPNELEFLPGDTYVGGVLVWNGGGYKFADNERVKLDTRFGPRLYRVRVTDRSLTFLSDDCEIKFLKE